MDSTIISCDVVTREKRPFLHETRYFVNFQAITISYHVAVLAIGFLHTYIHTWSRNSLGHSHVAHVAHVPSVQATSKLYTRHFYECTIISLTCTRGHTHDVRTI